MFDGARPAESVESAPPRVTLRNFFNHPFDSAIAAARTCYADHLIGPEEVTDKQRLNIGAATFNSGHHTVFQHATFEFGLENVSRQFVWSFLPSPTSPRWSTPSPASFSIAFGAWPPRPTHPARLAPSSAQWSRLLRISIRNFSIVSAQRRSKNCPNSPLQQNSSPMGTHLLANLIPSSPEKPPNLSTTPPTLLAS